MREPVKLHISLSILHGLERLDCLFINLLTKVFVKVVYYACVVLTTLLTSMGATIHLDTSHDTVLAPSTFFFVSEAEKPLNKGQDQV